MLKRCLTLVLLLWIIPSSKAQHSMNWVRLLGGSGDDYVSKIATDTQGNVYGIGHFQDSIQQLSSFGSSDVMVFIAKAFHIG